LLLGPVPELATSRRAKLVGDSETVGFAVSSAGDVDGDGRDDM
jgi:hypothetical protein